MSIISSQVQNLERATRQIETKARTLLSSKPKDPPTTSSSNLPTFASIAAQGPTPTQEWTLVGAKTKTIAKDKDLGSKEPNSKVKAKERQVILIQDLNQP